MPLGKCNPLFHRQQRKLLSGAKIVLYLAENPRMPEAGPAYHNSVNSVTLKCLRSLRTVANVPVTDNGNLHPRVCLHRANQAPVRASSVHLAASPSVYGQRTDADILKPFGKLHDNLRIFVPAEPGLDRNRLADSFNHGLGDSHHLVRLTHHARTCSSAGNLRNRTAEVDVYNVGAVPPGNLGGLVRHPRRVHHRLWNVPVNLDSDRSFFFQRPHLRYRLDRIPYKSVRGNKFSIDHICSLLAAQDAERHVRDILHRSKQNWPITQIQITYLHIPPV